MLILIKIFWKFFAFIVAGLNVFLIFTLVKIRWLSHAKKFSGDGFHLNKKGQGFDNF